MRKLIAFDDDTAAKLTQLARDRMATFQELADEAFTDLLNKHGIPLDLRDALRKSARQARASDKQARGSDKQARASDKQGRESAKVIPLSKRKKPRGG